MELNESQALRDVENSLRDYISHVLQRDLGDGWEDRCGVTTDRVNGWREKRDIEVKKLGSGIVESRLIYFADFYDLETIITKLWDPHFKDTFKDKKTFDVYFKTLSNLRNPEAHRRDLMDYQKHLVIGISGYFRNLIVAARSMNPQTYDVFPMLERMSDNYGNIWVQSSWSATTILHPGDELELNIKATDPKGRKLYYRVFMNTEWSESPTIKFTIKEDHVRPNHSFIVQVKSEDDLHRPDYCDDKGAIRYKVARKITP
jgi:hypothetical protein